MVMKRARTCPICDTHLRWSKSSTYLARTKSKVAQSMHAEYSLSNRRLQNFHIQNRLLREVVVNVYWVEQVTERVVLVVPGCTTAATSDQRRK